MPPLLQRLHAARGSSDPAQALPKLAQLLPPDTLGGLDAAVRLLDAAIAADRHIVVVGDFDCDGATACAVGVRGLRLLGARRVSHAVPNRLRHGYGLSPGLVEDLAALQPELLVTVDHGIACHAGIAAARARGWQVLVTDHHLPGDALPPADAIVNPNLRGDAFPSKALAGVGVMFYVLLALRRYLCDRPDREDPTAAIHGRTARQHRPDLSALLDLVAVGTVADLVPLDRNNRALVGAGLRRLRAGQGGAGLRALIEVAGRDPATLSAADIGFALAPRLNAAGRLEDMALGIECLLSDDPGHARALATTLDRINAERRAVQQQMTEDAERALARIALDGTLPPALCLFDPQWHPGVVGLVASRLKDRVQRPVFAFAPAQPGGDALRGSARSIPGLHIRDLLAAVDSAQPGLIERFGGHAMAAGLSLARAALPRFEQALHLQAARLLDPALLQAELLSDGELQPHEFDIAHARLLRDGGPWGQGYPEPLFDGEFAVSAWRVVGERHLKLELDHHGRRLDAIEFGGWDGTPPPGRVRLAYRLQPDDYRGGDAIQLVAVHREPA
ncbi:single-stranded-DNA-specific exonuclease RecJ [Luteimonas weifangensis]|uniref:Single-stranded-DNA-specific exonuclease RecJ n=2 Tax=Cognatiluteimonas weifangensis TaxID=2303539 RepID=A0A372DP35_9GAMM|nr:single-stranded-DNA-specific exonuclease RecJ [Luteimonas weifangensis]RFP61306.1 single-stranded-DNA-specific exonuclease RecJ [Luteimonas weifangensis]